ncbi:MAG: STM3941 family protein [Capnocytophaga sp.]|nr:STM3941 family protein [Capnocytophaga sp.]
MTKNEQIEIPLSKKKITSIFLGSIIFVGLGFWFLTSPPKINHVLIGSSTVISIVGLVSVLFFGLVSIVTLRKLSDKKAGFIINNQGIIDNSSGISAGLVLWADIKEIKITQVMSEKFLTLIVKDPQSYLRKITNPLKRKGMEWNYRLYGSPISISANSLQANFDELNILLAEKLREHQS